MSKKLTSIVLCFLIFFTYFVVKIPYNVNAQVTEEWVARYISPGNSGSSCAITVDSSGNIYVTGVSSGGNNYGRTDDDYATVAYNPYGDQLWVARYNGPGKGHDKPVEIVIDTSGDIYVTGVSYGSGTDDDFATIKYDSDGNELWVARYNGPGNGVDSAFDIGIDSSGNIYVTGESYGSGTDSDFATIKYDSDGNQLWIARYNGPRDLVDWGDALVLDSLGNVYVTGSSYGSGSYYDYATIKYDSDGNQLWVARYNGPGNREDSARGIALDESSGKVYITGDSVGYNSYADYTTIAYDFSGNELWVARYDGPVIYYDYPLDIALDPSGNVFITGWSAGSGRNHDLATVKYDPNGNELWVARYNGSANYQDGASGIALDSSGNAYVTGFIYGNNSFDSTTIAYDPAGNELWIAIYDGPANEADCGSDIAVDPLGYVYITGYSNDIESQDYITIKYSQPCSNHRPIADASGPYSAIEGLDSFFSAWASYDPDGDPLEYRWDFENDGFWDTEWSDLPFAFNTYGDDFSGDVKVQVGDGRLASIGFATITVANVPPFVNAGLDKTVHSGEIIGFTGSYLDPGWLDTHTYEWDFGEGSLISGTLIPTHIYYNEDVYIVTLIVTDDDGGIGQDTCEITVIPMQAALDIDPDTLNLDSKGRWITAYIGLPDGYDIYDIDISTVLLNEVIPADWGDIQGTIYMVKFDRSDVEDLIGAPEESVELTVTGELIDGTQFEGSDVIRAIEPP